MTRLTLQRVDRDDEPKIHDRSVRIWGSRGHQAGALWYGKPDTGRQSASNGHVK
jgi:hypothetical protein